MARNALASPIIRFLSSASLSEKEAYILEHRLLTDDPVTLREIGERYNVTRERVRQLEARLLQKLKTHLSTDIQDFSEDWISH